MKTTKSFKLYRIALSITAIALLSIISGCSTSKILAERDDVPPPKYTPTEKTNNDQLKSTDMEPIVSQPIQTFPQDISDFPAVKQSRVEYKVKKGDSFWKISRMYGVSMRELAAYNNMDLKKPLIAGTVIEIPPGGKLVVVPQQASMGAAKAVTATKPVKSAVTTSNVDVNGIYTVKSGDSLWGISKKLGTSVASLTAANGISKTSILQVGQKLKIPAGAKTTTGNAVKVPKPTGNAISTYVKEPVKPVKRLSKEDEALINNLLEDNNSSGSSTPLENKVQAALNYLPHTVKEGDTWSTISEMYGVSVDSLKKANPDVNTSDEPKVGSVINIPEE